MPVTKKSSSSAAAKPKAAESASGLEDKISSLEAEISGLKAELKAQADAAAKSHAELVAKCDACCAAAAGGSGAADGRLDIIWKWMRKDRHFRESLR